MRLLRNAEHHLLLCVKVVCDFNAADQSITKFDLISCRFRHGLRVLDDSAPVLWGPHKHLHETLFAYPPVLGVLSHVPEMRRRESEEQE